MDGGVRGSCPPSASLPGSRCVGYLRVRNARVNFVVTYLGASGDGTTALVPVAGTVEQIGVPPYAPVRNPDDVSGASFDESLADWRRAVLNGGRWVTGAGVNSNNLAVTFDYGEEKDVRWVTVRGAASKNIVGAELWLLNGASTVVWRALIDSADADNYGVPRVL